MITLENNKSSVFGGRFFFYVFPKTTTIRLAVPAHVHFFPSYSAKYAFCRYMIMKLITDCCITPKCFAKDQLTKFLFLWKRILRIKTTTRNIFICLSTLYLHSSQNFSNKLKVSADIIKFQIWRVTENNHTTII